SVRSSSAIYFVPNRARSFLTVRMREISRFAWRSRALFSSTPVAVWKRRLKSSWRVSAIFSSSSSSESSRSSLAFKEIRLPLHELRLERELLPGEAERLLRERLRNAGELEHDAARLHDRDPPLGRALAGAHAGLRRLLGEGLVREEVDPDLPAPPDLAGGCDTGGLDLPVGDPTGLDGLQPEVAELDRRLALRVSGPPTTVVAAELRLPRHQHQASPSVSTVVSGEASVAGASFAGAS